MSVDELSVMDGSKCILQLRGVRSFLSNKMVANKLIGEKGVLFTALYVKKFNLMEASERAEMEAHMKKSKTHRLKP